EGESRQHPQEVGIRKCGDPRQRRREASGVISVLKVLETGHAALAFWARATKCALAAPGILAFRSKWTEVMAKPSSSFSSVTFAEVSIRSAFKFASPRIKERAMVKQPAWAAAKSSSGLVPATPSKRLAKPYGYSFKAPL